MAVLPALLAAVTLILFGTRMLRADGVAVLALAVAVATGLVAPGRALAGFSDPVVVTIGALSVLASAVHRSGLVDAPRGALLRRWRLTTPVLLLSGFLVALLAAISGRVGTRSALLRSSRLPESATGASRPVLMLNLACLLGGTLTVVGGVPNLLASAVRADWLGAPFAVLAFAPAGALLLAAGLLLFALTSLLARGSAVASESAHADSLRHVRHFTAELALPPGCPIAGRSIGALEIASEHAFRVTALVREGLRRIEAHPDWVIEPHDVLVLDCQPADLQRLVERWGLQPADDPLVRFGGLGGVAVVQAVVTQSSELVGRAPTAGGLTGRAGVHLLGLGRNDVPPLARLRRTRLRSGDVLVLAAETDAVPQTLSSLGCLLLSEQRLRLGRRHAALPLAILLLALAAAAVGAVPLWLSLLGGIAVLVLSGLLTLGEAYERVPWPGLVMVAALLPLATALHESAVPAEAVRWIGPFVANAGAVLAAAAGLIAAMGASLLFGSAVAVLLLCPFAVAMAAAAALPPDLLLMAVAVGASVDMLDGRGLLATLVPAPGRRPIPFWPSGAAAAAMLVLCGAVALGVVWRP